MNKLRSRIGYIAVLAATAVLILSLLLWAGIGSSAPLVNYLDAEVKLPETLPDEYLVGEQIETEGIVLVTEKGEFSGKDLTFTVDNATAGLKMVEVSHTDGRDLYRAWYPVTFFAIRHLVMRQAPDVTFDEEGYFVSMTGLILWADLSGKSTRFAAPEGDEANETTVLLTEDHYTVSAEQPDANGGITVNITCGKLATSVYYFTADGKTFLLDGPHRLLTLENLSGTDDVMTLIVTKHVASAPGKYNICEGYYFLQRADGSTLWLKFGYYLEDGTWRSVFQTPELNPDSVESEILYPEADPQYPDHIEVKLTEALGGLVFHATAGWRDALLT